MIIENFEGKYERNKIERKSKGRKNKKVDLKLINYFYIFFQTHLTYFIFLYKNKIIGKCIIKSNIIILFPLIKKNPKANLKKRKKWDKTIGITKYFPVLYKNGNKILKNEKKKREKK